MIDLPSERMTIESDIKEKALELGFDAVGITAAASVEPKQVEYYQQWLDDGNAAKMEYLHRNTDKRFDPAELFTGAKSVICVALNYRPSKTESYEKEDVRIANFTLYEDYHPFIKDRLFQLAEFVQKQTKAWSGSDTIKFKACVDSVPLAERALAQRAGLGFIGKNHMLIHPEFGNQILLGELITTLELEPDEPLENLSCGDCGKCIRACPTGALDKDGSFDARKCISYLTIEAPDDGRVGHAHADGNADVNSSPPAKGEYPEGGRGLQPIKNTCDRDGYTSNYIFGCDECILACPHEINAPTRNNKDFQFHPEWQKLTPRQILAMTENKFQKTFVNSGFIRLGLERLKRNCSELAL